MRKILGLIGFYGIVLMFIILGAVFLSGRICDVLTGGGLLTGMLTGDGTPKLGVWVCSVSWAFTATCCLLDLVLITICVVLENKLSDDVDDHARLVTWWIAIAAVVALLVALAVNTCLLILE